MMDIHVHGYSDFSTFLEAWPIRDADENLRDLWTLMRYLEDDEVIVVLPEWLADEKIGFHDGATPTEFVGRIDRDTMKAIRLEDSAAAKHLMRVAHRLAHIEDGLATIRDAPARIEWLEGRRDELRGELEDRDDVPGLRDEWLPKSQIEFVARRVGPG